MKWTPTRVAYHLTAEGPAAHRAGGTMYHKADASGRTVCGLTVTPSIPTRRDAYCAACSLRAERG